MTRQFHVILAITLIVELSVVDLIAYRYFNDPEFNFISASRWNIFEFCPQDH